MRHWGLLAFWLLAAMLAVFGWFRQQRPLRPEAVLYVWHWSEEGSDPLVYAVMDSTAVVRLGDCIYFRDAKGEGRVLCRNYRVSGAQQRAGLAGRELIPAYMKERGPAARALPTGDEQVKHETDQPWEP